jgi:hypothetical protein
MLRPETWANPGAAVAPGRLTRETAAEISFD